MIYFEKDINSLEQADLQWLIDTTFAEASVIEYKSRLNFGTNEEIEKVLYQVSSFANAGGGDLIYGIEASKGVPAKLEGQPENDADGFVQKIENVIAKGIHPRLSSFVTRPVPLANGNHAFVFRIQQSWNRPHQVRFNNRYVFYTRSSNGLAQIDVEDLRNLFVGAQEVKQRIEDFRARRISDLVAGNTPVGSMKPPLAVLHFVPLSKFAEGASYDPQVFSANREKLAPRDRGALNSFRNFDGFGLVSNGEHGADYYAQGFRDLRIEEVFAEFLHATPNGPASIHSAALAEELFVLVDEALEFYRICNVAPPIILMLTLVGVKGLKFRPSQRAFSVRDRPIDRDVLLFPATLIDDYNVGAKRLLRPTLDIFWQSAGYQRCFYYNDEGDWLD